MCQWLQMIADNKKNGLHIVRWKKNTGQGFGHQGPDNAATQSWMPETGIIFRNDSQGKQENTNIKFNRIKNVDFMNIFDKMN